MTLLLVGVLAFFGIHCVALVGLRDGVAARVGEGPWKGLYSLVAIGGLVAMVWGYGQARMTPTYLWVPPVWTRHLALTLLLPIFPLLFSAYLPGRLQALVRHPMMVATLIWSGSHLLANGATHDVVLFGSFFVWSLAMLVSYRFRTLRPVPGASPSAVNDWIAIIGGLLLYGATLMGLHEWLFGVAPLF